ncbi:CBS domain-containing protein [Thiomicrorhabdus lithotrophica]|uniref:CBS domain-containing protein n=1 Tax=Thiomicrorhabdus lithotrophica TaxID=2949997 RepID=A0ABY8CAG7_9GAMM|nr:CBS domain-containing protein [Thiomicrorhabdus lithotrophica]WEJ61680.1 CBS domain-containing protein [Thiomicrorhabdus lithotrophica]
MSAEVIKVKHVMKPDVDVVDGMMTVYEVLNTMKHKQNKSIIVQRRDEHDEYGIVLLNDIATEVLGKDRSPERVNVYEIMTKPVVSVDPEMDIRYCARLFKRLGLSRAPVIENRKVVGMVSLTDLVLKGLCKTD